MAAREHHPEEVLVDVRDDLGGELLGVESDLSVSTSHALSPEHVPRAVLRDGKQPGGGVRRKPLGPRLERRDERLLGDVLGEGEVPAPRRTE